MSKKIYVGVNNKARNTIKAYGGVGNKAHTLIKGYVGDSNGKARLFWSKAEEGVLWDYKVENHNAILYGRNTYNATLRSAIENYQKIVIEIRPYYADTCDNFIIIPTGVLHGCYTPNRTAIGTQKGIWRDRYGVFDITGTSLNKVKDTYGNAYGNSMGLVKVWGFNDTSTCTLLWDYNTDGGGVIPYGTGSITLNYAIENFDQIILEIVCAPDNLQYPNEFTFLYTLSVNALQNAYRPNYFNFTSWYNVASVFYMSGTTLRKDANGQGNTNGIIKVWGVKY